MSYERHVDRLMDDARELVSKLHDTKNPDLKRLRDRVDAFVSGPRRISAGRAARQRVSVTRIPGSLLDYVHDHPWLALVTATSLAWTLGPVSSASRQRRS
jgi:ElaB/YqjD/DUF883 family membrane-anchored ribosome-binding protein